MLDLDLIAVQVEALRKGNDFPCSIRPQTSSDNSCEMEEELFDDEPQHSSPRPDLK